MILEDLNRTHGCFRLLKISIGDLTWPVSLVHKYLNFSIFFNIYRGTLQFLTCIERSVNCHQFQYFEVQHLWKTFLWYSNVSIRLILYIFGLDAAKRCSCGFRVIGELVACWPWPALAQWTRRPLSTHQSSTSRRLRASPLCWRIYLW